jgi:hypothetical protein
MSEHERTPAEAAELVLASMLQSPYFLYRWELGWQPAGRVGNALRVNPFYLASQLSYFLWSSMPDAELLDKAGSGALNHDAEVSAQVTRMLADPRVERTVAAFHEQWLGVFNLPDLGKAGGLFPEWNTELGESMREQVRRFVVDTVVRGDGRVQTLFTAVNVPVDAKLGAIYEVDAPEQWTSMALPDTRSGILTLPGFLAAHALEAESSPILRGKFVRERVLCNPLAPPAGDIPELPEPEPGVSTRERYSEHSTVQPCAACHQLMDDIGFGFENFDAIGRYRSMEGEHAVDARGKVVRLDGTDRDFDGAVQLSQILATSNQARDCMTREWFRFALSRKESSADDDALRATFQRFSESDFDIRSLLVAIATSLPMSHRSMNEGEVLQ